MGPPPKGAEGALGALGPLIGSLGPVPWQSRSDKSGVEKTRSVYAGRRARAERNESMLKYDVEKSAHTFPDFQFWINF